ncbi:MAG: hypothetical protein ABID09_01255 [Candidatus Omnitrophota bacterium]
MKLHFKTEKNIFGVALILVVVILILGSSIRGGHRAATSLYPLINDTWYSVLNAMREKTPEDAIINSWWDFGDWFKVIARRRVIFDGQSQNNPQAYWMAKALLTNNENEAIGILRMLNNGGNKAFDIIHEHIKDPLEAVMLLEAVIPLPNEEAKQMLEKFLSAETVDNVMRMLFSRPSNACFVVENTMLHKMSAISYLGNWDFSKVYMAQTFDSKEKDYIMDHLRKLGSYSADTERFYQEVFLISTKNLDEWLSQKLQVYTALVDGQEAEDGNIYFGNNFIYNPKDKTIGSNTGQIPRSLFVLDGNTFSETASVNANVIFSAVVFKKDDTYKCIMMDRELAASMFARLYFFKGAGLRHFAPLIDMEEKNIYIRVFNIVW